ncbi:hypothetical protein Syun_017772 [Stephania yunnanensis]|uniref:Uncharacterized protein n=1 Tax=Stephania yunnanensis TaxID=152371 RepID=A0AAP0J8I4_9MAGN
MRTELAKKDDDDGMDDFYLSGSSDLRIGNRRWGSNGYVRTGRREARLVKIGNGRRAKRAMKREAADRAAPTAAAITAQARLFPISVILLEIVAQEEVTDEYEEYYLFEEEDDDGMDDFYLSGSSNLRIGNRRWRSNGYVRTRRREARLISNEGFQQDLDHVGSSRHANKGKK